MVDEHVMDGEEVFFLAHGKDPSDPFRLISEGGRRGYWPKGILESAGSVV